jgi:23S rRNA (uracil1939-C5)-methyltransferase
LTQAQNIAELSGYQIIYVQPVDQFPHTPHIENIVLLLKI